MKPIQKSTAGRIGWRRLPLLLLTLLASGLVQAELAVDRSTATTQDRPGVLRRAAPAAVKPVFAAGPDNAVLPLQDVDFRRSPDGVGRVLVSLSSSQVGVDVRQQGNKLVVTTQNGAGTRRRAKSVSRFSRRCARTLARWKKWVAL